MSTTEGPDHSIDMPTVSLQSYMASHYVVSDNLSTAYVVRILFGCARHLHENGQPSDTLLADVDGFLAEAYTGKDEHDTKLDAMRAVINLIGEELVVQIQQLLVSSTATTTVTFREAQPVGSCWKSLLRCFGLKKKFWSFS